ncbi:hypothetical protein [Allomuricauda sp. CP2A]|jgi:hypothetical protein|uniref:hypothetical protein n=1 Tax=Allomuricauda sp. CP2A TaxID=1848189 RepID=UPI00083565D8|nr:hypothetical protein [Muricauda sp. CP2A]
MDKVSYIIFTAFLVIAVSCLGPKERPNTENARDFFAKLAMDGGTWVHNPSDTTMAFHSFIMKFERREEDTLTGKIMGRTKTGDTIPFWRVEEYIDVAKDSIIFIQQGQHGNAKGTSIFPDPMTRESNFKMVYSNGLAQNHKDTHVFINDSTMLTQSKIFDNQTQKWIDQPDVIWTFKH